VWQSDHERYSTDTVTSVFHLSGTQSLYAQAGTWLDFIRLHHLGWRPSVFPYSAEGCRA
jgi:hypothetical protein